MEEKILIKSEKSQFVIRVLIVCLCLLVVSGILWAIISERSFGWFFTYHWGFLYNAWVPSVIFDLSLIVSIFCLVFIIANRSVTLTVTDKRVYGTAKWGKRVDLPLDMISAVATAKLGGISVSTSSGVIRFLAIKNNEEIHEAISKLLMERQGKEKPASVTTINQEIPQSNADELQKYKNLLDNGTITQEEFDAKKKQLLGL